MSFFHSSVWIPLNLNLMNAAMSFSPQAHPKRTSRQHIRDETRRLVGRLPMSPWSAFWCASGRAPKVGDPGRRKKSWPIWTDLPSFASHSISSMPELITRAVGSLAPVTGAGDNCTLPNEVQAIWTREPSESTRVEKRREPRTSLFDRTVISRELPLEYDG